MHSPTLISPLGCAIQKESEKLVRLASAISPEERTSQLENGKICAADLIAYQIGWGRCLIRWYEGGIKGEKPEMPGEGFSKWDYSSIAAHFHRKYAFDREEKQIEEFERTVQSILEIVEKEYRTGNLDKLGIWEWCTLKSGKPWPLEKWVRVNALSPYKRASSLLAKAVSNL